MMKTAKVAAVLFLSMLPLGAISMGLVACNNDDDEYGASPNNSTTMRLKSITYSRGSYKTSGTLTYDDAGRITSFYGFKYEYEGANTIKCVRNNSVSFCTLDKDGKVISAKDVEENYESTFNYSNDRLASVDIAKYNEHYNYTWNGNNLKQMVENYNGEIETWVWKYNNIKTHPIIHALFGFHAYGGDVEAAPSLTEIGFVLPLYNHLGTLPKNLFSELACTDDYNNTYISTFSYSIDSSGNVIGITIIEDGDKVVYSLIWEETSGINNIKTDKAPSKVRTISGMNTGRKANELKELPKGVYIVDGKKVVKTM